MHRGVIACFIKRPCKPVENQLIILHFELSELFLYQYLHHNICDQNELVLSGKLLMDQNGEWI